MARMLRALALAASLALVVSPGVHAGDSGRGDKGRAMSADEAVQRALSKVNREHQGRVLSARPVSGSGGQVRVRVKFLSADGVIRTLVVDPGEG